MSAEQSVNMKSNSTVLCNGHHNYLFVIKARQLLIKNNTENSRSFSVVFNVNIFQKN
jgi:hypothetical protein